jgi:hypothetical protein
LSTKKLQIIGKFLETESLPLTGGTMTGAINTYGIVLNSEVDYGTEYPTEAVEGQLFLLEDTPHADYIVSQGITDGWIWRKWNSGVAECWFSGISDISAQATIDAGLYCAWGTLDFPFLFDSAPVVTYSVTATNGYDFCGKANVNTGNFNWYIGCSTANIQSLSSISIRAHVIGKLPSK